MMLVIDRRIDLSQRHSDAEINENEIDHPAVILMFDFFARRIEFVEEKSPGADAPRLASTVFFVVQFLLVIGLQATAATVPSWWKKKLLGRSW